MQPDYRIMDGGSDITGSFQGRISEIRLTDVDGIKSDQVVITLDNEGYAVAVPPKGKKLTVMIGYVETGLVDKGQFTVDDVTLEEPPSIMIITAKAADLRQGSKTQRNKSYERPNQKLKDVLGEIAGRMGLGLQLSPSLQNIPLAYWVQNNESDVHTIERLARRHDAILKVTGGRLIGVKRQEGMNSMGTAFGAVSIVPEMCKSWRCKLSDRPDHSQVEAQWLDRGQASRTPVIVGGGGGLGARHVLPQVFPSEEEAKKAAETRQRELASAKGTFNAVLPGMPELTAEVPLALSGFPAPISGQQWMIKRVEHIMIGRSTFETNVQAEVKKGGSTDGASNSRSGSNAASSSTRGELPLNQDFQTTFQQNRS